ncbi:spore coat U domain-containing protein [Pseudoxanthomonas daejeonensis]|uniref:Csu type fimbrial protein n=1 Tax=Pseudoxanthomonas daejeonensis TaxID=266062 RepID=UPI001F53FA3B|nr:spore coat U domain-containing protein [Pseudoxanthomonas daejeonensis]UNK56751.1 spore coat U domain-containing protein [Pseudoxanthomonas daejeonensis]
MNLFKSTLIATALVAAGFAGTANAATATGNFQAKIVITESCTFSTAGASDVDFLSKARSSAGDVDATGTLVVTCTSGTPYTIALNAGSYGGATVTTRRMHNGTGVGVSVPYTLYRNTGRTQNWGNTAGTDTVAGTGNGNAQNVSVYGRVLSADTNVPAGTYADTITATINY